MFWVPPPTRRTSATGPAGSPRPAAQRATDSVRQETEDGATRALERSTVWLVETPQAFDCGLLRRAHDHAKATGVKATDDASLVEACTGHAIAIVETEGRNLKVTTADDLKLVRLIIPQAVS